MTQSDRVSHDREWRELYKRIKSVLRKFKEEAEGGVGDYFLIDEIVEPYVHFLELHKLHMLHPKIMNSLPPALAGFPHWQIKVLVVSMQEKTIIDPDNGLLIRSGGIVDILDRTMLPPTYRELRYE